MKNENDVSKQLPDKIELSIFRDITLEKNAKLKFRDITVILDPNNKTDSAGASKEKLTVPITFTVVPHFYTVTNFNSFIDKLDRNRTTAITGITGSGKTQLALKYREQYALNHPDHLTHVFYSDEINTLKNGYRAFLAKFGIKMNLSLFDEIVRIVADKINEYPGSLIIYDGADDPEIKHFILSLINQFDKKCKSNIKIIITTQDENFFINQDNMIHLSGFFIEDSVRFLKVIVSYIKDDDAEHLATELGNLPFGLSTAAFFLNNNVSISVNEYLQSLESERRDFFDEIESEINTEFNYQKMEKSANQLAAINLSMKKLSNEALELLNMVGFMSPERVLISTIDSDEHLRAIRIKAIHDLKRYSLITEYRDCISIHKITQSMVRISLNLTSKKLVCLSVSDIINKLFTYHWNSYETVRPSEQVILHAAELSKHLIKINVQNITACDLACKIGTYYLYHIRDFLRAISMFHNSISLCPKEERIRIASIHNHLAFACYQEELFSDARHYNALAIETLSSDANQSFCMAFAYRVKGYCLLRSENSDPKSAEKEFLKALAIQQTIIYPDIKQKNLSIARTLFDLGKACRKQASFYSPKLTEAKNYYLQALQLEGITNINRIKMEDLPKTQNAARTFHEFAALEYKNGNYPAAYLYINYSISIKQNYVGKSNYWILESRYLLAFIFYKNKQYKEAICEFSFYIVNSMTILDKKSNTSSIYRKLRKAYTYLAYSYIYINDNNSAKCAFNEGSLVLQLVNRNNSFFIKSIRQLLSDTDAYKICQHNITNEDINDSSTPQLTK